MSLYSIVDDLLQRVSPTTDIDVGKELLEFGIPRYCDGFNPPYKRPYTGYGVA